MFANAMRAMCALSLLGCLGMGAPPADTKCSPCKNKAKPSCKPACKAAAADAEALPPNAKPGECYAKFYVPPEYKTVTERVMVRAAYEEMEIIPAQYEWVEERVCVKDASEQLRAMPAEFATREVNLQVRPAETVWEVNKNPTCVADTNQPARDVFCLVNHAAVHQTLQTQCLAKPAQVERECVPAEYQTIRRQKLVAPATTRKVCIPAEYAEVQKTIKVCDGKMVWKRVVCDLNQGVVSQAPAAPVGSLVASD